MTDSEDNQAYHIDRAPLNVQKGSLVQKDGIGYKVSQVLDFESVIGINIESGRSQLLRIGDLRSIGNDEELHPAYTSDIDEIGDDDWKVAQERFSAIKPLLDTPTSRKNVQQRADDVGVNTATLYRWLKKYQSYQSVSALIPRKRGWRQGNHRIEPQMQEVIDEVIENYYLTPQRPTVQKAILEVQRLCQKKFINPPSPATIRNRISSISERERLRKRGYKEKAKNKFLPAAGHFPNADYPLAVIQIDHTPADIILVDDQYRKPIGRPWITLAMDVYSRMVTGYYISFDAPSETSIAMCIAHSMTPKEEWLIVHNVEAEWPVWGIPKTIHVDNGADFRSNSFQRSCQMYGINLEYRPVKQPRYGGHIERLLGTLLKEIHHLPGTTFSSIKDRDEYDSDKHATMTKSEFEEWLAALICKVYHQRKHSSLGVSPKIMWETGVFGNDQVQGVGVPPIPKDRHTILLDFLPSFHRTIQTFGVTIDGLRYYDESLRPWINAENQSEKTQFLFRRDPRDISILWFYEPELKHYFKVPFANQLIPSMSIWEYRKAKETLKQQDKTADNETNIINAIDELRQKVEDSKGRTRKARREAQRRKEHKKKTIDKKIKSPSTPVALKPNTNELIDGDVDIFGEIE